MPKQARYQIKQKLDTVISEITKAQDKLTEVGALFKEQHPDYYDGFCSLIATLDQLRIATEVMRDSI